MVYLAIKSDSDRATIALLDDDGQHRHSWLSGRELSDELLVQLELLLRKRHHDWSAVTGLIVFRGPGSFTGLRIASTVANAIAYSLDLPIVGETGEGWLATGQQRLAAGANDEIVVPEYGAPANVTLPGRPA